ncbi:hypothetical protein [Nocardia sp. NPDC003345]
MVIGWPERVSLVPDGLSLGALPPGLDSGQATFVLVLVVIQLIIQRFFGRLLPIALGPQPALRLTAQRTRERCRRIPRREPADDARSWDDREWRYRALLDEDPSREEAGRASLTVGRDVLAVNGAVARNYGVVVDDLWPRLELVVPPLARRRIVRSEWRAGGSRITAIVGAGAIAPFATAGSGYAVLAMAIVVAVSVAACRREVSAAYSQKARAIGLYRADLARKLGLRPPSTNAELTAMGGFLTGEDTVGEWFAATSFPLAEDTANTRLARSRRGNARDTSSELRPPAVVAELKAHLDTVVERAVANALRGPELVAFTGFFGVELPTARRRTTEFTEGKIVAPSGTSIEIAVALSTRPTAASRLGRRSNFPNEQTVVFEKVEIPGPSAARTPSFEVLIDSGTVTAIPRRLTVDNTDRRNPTRHAVELRLPGLEDSHDIWFQLFQGGRLVQVVSLAVETRQNPAPEPGHGSSTRSSS